MSITTIQQALDYLAARSTKHNVTNRAPTATDDVTAGYKATSQWIDAATGTIYECTNPTATAAVWAQVYPAAGGGGGSETWSEDEIPAGSIDGTNTTFTLTHTPIVLFLFMNGLKQTGSGNDFSRSGSTITMTAAPLPGDFLVATYTYTSGGGGGGGEDYFGGDFFGDPFAGLFG